MGYPSGRHGRNRPSFKETLIKPRTSLQGSLNLIHETAGRDDSASPPLLIP